MDKKLEEIKQREEEILKKEKEILSLLDDFTYKFAKIYNLIEQPIENDKNITININVINNNITK